MILASMPHQGVLPKKMFALEFKSRSSTPELKEFFYRDVEFVATLKRRSFTFIHFLICAYLRKSAATLLLVRQKNPRPFPDRGT